MNKQHFDKSIEVIKQKYHNMAYFLNEKSKRVWCATEAAAYGRGGIKIVHEATGISRPTIIKGIKEIKLGNITNETNGCRVIGVLDNIFLENNKLSNGLYVLTRNNQKLFYQCINGNYAKLRLKKTDESKDLIQELKEGEIYSNLKQVILILYIIL